MNCFSVQPSVGTVFCIVIVIELNADTEKRTQYLVLNE